jgi:hypothetical protein
MKLFKASLLFSIAITAVAGCASPPKPYESKLDPLALQQLQTQEFETSKKILFASVVSVFQDTGFTIEAGDLATGIITAKSPTTTELKMFLYQTSGVRATAFVEETKKSHAKVRLNFIESSSVDAGYGAGSPNEIPNEDPTYYEKIFNKIREAVFLRDAYKVTPESPK